MAKNDLKHLRRSDLLGLLEDLSRENDRLRAELAKANKTISEINVKLAEREEIVSQAHASVADRDVQLARANAAIADRDAQIAKRSELVDAAFRLSGILQAADEAAQQYLGLLNGATGQGGAARSGDHPAGASSPATAASAAEQETIDRARADVPAAPDGAASSAQEHGNAQPSLRDGVLPLAQEQGTDLSMTQEDDPAPAESETASRMSNPSVDALSATAALAASASTEPGAVDAETVAAVDNASDRGDEPQDDDDDDNLDDFPVRPKHVRSTVPSAAQTTEA